MKQFIGFQLIKDNALYSVSICSTSIKDAVSILKLKYDTKYWMLYPMLDKYLKDDAEDIIENLITKDYRKYCCRNHINCCLDSD